MSARGQQDWLAMQLARFTADVVWDRLPDTVRRLAVQAFRDWIGNAAAGGATPFGRAIVAVAKTSCMTGTAHLVGCRETTGPMMAALVNGGASHTLEFDDSHKGTFYHPGAPAIPAALAAAQLVNCDGPTLLSGIVAGYEVGIRVAAAMGPAHYRVWHTTGTAGTFAAAAAAARVFKLPPESVAAAIGLAGTQAAGLWEVLPEAPIAKNLHPGRAAQSGLLAALLSREGLKGPVSILEGRRGVLAAMVPEGADPQACVKDLGRQWRIREITFKAYPICGHAMTPVEAALQVRSKIGSSDIVVVTVHTNSISVGVAGDQDPCDGYAAKFSIPYCVAAALTRGRVTQAEFEPDVLDDPSVRDLTRRVKLVVDPEYERIARTLRPARLVAVLDDGRTVDAVAENRRGDPERPLSEEELTAKFLSLASLAWGPETARAVSEGFGFLAKSKSINAWIRRYLFGDASEELSRR